MERNVNYLTVGIVVLVALAGFTVFLTWILGGLDSRKYDRYSIEFHDAVSGLNISSPVEYKGVRVGKVIAIVLDENKPDLIRVDIEVTESTPVRSNTRVQMGIQGITGLSRIELETADNTGQKVPRPKGAPYPVLQGDGRQLTKLFEDIPGIAQNVLKITERLNTLMDDRMLEDLRATVANMKTLSGDLNGLMSEQNVANLSTTLDNAAQASANMRDIGPRIEKTAAEFEKVAATLTDTITANQDNLNRFTGDGLAQITAMSKEMRTMAAEFRKLAAKLREEPSSVIYKPKTNGVKIAP